MGVNMLSSHWNAATGVIFAVSLLWALALQLEQTAPATSCHGRFQILLTSGPAACSALSILAQSGAGKELDDSHLIQQSLPSDQKAGLHRLDLSIDTLPAICPCIRCPVISDRRTP